MFPGNRKDITIFLRIYLSVLCKRIVDWLGRYDDFFWTRPGSGIISQTSITRRKIAVAWP